MTEPTAAQLSELIGSIYDRAIDPEAWDETLGRMRAALGAEMGALGLIDLRRREILLSYVDNIPHEWMDRLARNAGDIVDLWGGLQFAMSHPLEEPALLRQVNPTSGVGTNGYRDEAIARGFTDAMNILIARDDNVIGSCLFGRVRGTGQFRERELSLARLLAPHLQRAIAFSRMFELATLRASAFEAALETIAVPTILVTGRSELVHANPAGHSELEHGAVLRMVGSRVTIADRSREGGLSKALATARERPDADPQSFNVDLAGVRQLKLLPLPRGSVRGTLAPSATAAIILTGSGHLKARNESAIIERLIVHHGLTKSEAAVALEIAKGDGRAAAADRLGIRDNTVRTHLSSIFLKLDINRQAQLVRLIETEAGVDEVALPTSNDG